VKRVCVALVLTCAALASAQQADVDRYVREHQQAIVRELMELVAIPDVRSDLPNIKRNAELLRGMLDRRATAEIAMRLVKENSPRQMIDRVLAHIRRQGYFVVEADPDAATLAAHPRIAKVTSRGGAASGAWRTDPETPAARFITDALTARYGGRLVRIRTLGGGVPAGPFIDAFHVPTLGISLANYDDNQHTDNENLRLGNLWSGIATLAAIMTAR